MIRRQHITRHALELWVMRGVPHPDELGSFLRSLLLHDLMGAAMHADDENGACLREWAIHIHNNVPALCHGSVSRLREWHALGGLEGFERRVQEDVTLKDGVSAPEMR